MWERFFEEVDDKYVRCIECNDACRLISRSGNTSNYKRHVVRFHPEAYNDYLRTAQPAQKGPRRSKKVEQIPSALDYTCRACLVEDKTWRFSSLLEEPLRTMFYESTTVEVSANDELSTVLCSLCVSRCDSAKAFRDMAIKNDQESSQRQYGGLQIISVETVQLENIPTQHGDIQISIPAAATIDHHNHLQQTVVDHSYGETISYIEEDVGDVETVIVGELVEEEECVEECIEEEIADAKDEGPQAADAPVGKTFLGKPLEACQFCNHKFSTRLNLMHHYQDQHPDSVYGCVRCDKSFIDPDTWRQHVCATARNKHRCEECGKVFLRPDRLKLHMEEHQGDPKTYSCHICAKEFRIKSNLYTHIKRHSNVKNFQCTLCTAKFKEKRELVRHTALVHTRAKPHGCQVCSRAFEFRYMLDRHMQVHTGEKRFRCPYEKCGQKLSSGNALKHHIYTHTGEKPYKCEQCDAAYRLKVTLNQHIKDNH